MRALVVEGYLRFVASKCTHHKPPSVSRRQRIARWYNKSYQESRDWHLVSKVEGASTTRVVGWLAPCLKFQAPQGIDSNHVELVVMPSRATELVGVQLCFRHFPVLL